MTNKEERYELTKQAMDAVHLVETAGEALDDLGPSGGDHRHSERRGLCER